MAKQLLRNGMLTVFCMCLLACGIHTDRVPMQTAASAVVQGTPEPEKTSIPKAAADLTPTPEPKRFTMLWIADTQNDAYLNDKGLKSIIGYAIEKKDELNLIAVLHSGDVVENNAKDAEWERIEKDLEPLRGNIPFYCVCGNHDVGYGTGEAAVRQKGYGQYCKYDLCDVRAETQRYNNGECWYRFLEEQQLLLVGIGWPLDREDPARLEWLDRVLDTYAAYPVLILTHNYLYNNGLLSTGGTRLERDVVSRHANIRLLLCGHHKGIRRLRQTYEDGNRTFTAVMYNLQADKTNGTGYCMLLTFDPVLRSVSFTSYSPYFDDYNYLGNPDRETFLLENAF